MGSKVQILNYNYEVNFNDFLPNFLCVLTNKTFQTEISFYYLGHAPGVGLGGALGVWGVKEISVGICDSAPLTVHSCFPL